MKAIIKQVTIAVILTLLFASCASSQKIISYTTNLPAYVIYDSEGNTVTYDEMMKSLELRQVVFFGEIHNDAMSHWLEKLVLRDLYNIHDNNLVVGCEMWESNGQALIDSLATGEITRDYYLKNAKMWPNVMNDYLPLFDFCIKRDIPFVAANIPAILSHYVAEKGPQILDQMPDKIKAMLAPTPYKFNLEESAYKTMASGLMSDEQWLVQKKAGKLGNDPMAKFKPSFLIKAQACRDATMAYRIATRLTDKDKRFFHFNGEMHSGGNTGILYYLRQYKPGVDIGTISVKKMKDPLKFDAKDSRADYNIVVPSSMYTSYKQ
ncbi:MAG: ChaN family lipoprotein [Bacteroidales bacterium]